MSGIRGFTKTLTGRLLVAAICWSVPALFIAYFALSTAFKDYVIGQLDRQLQSNMDSLLGASEIAPDGVVRLVRPIFDQRFSEPYSGWYWQISEEGHLPFRSRSLWDSELKPDMDTRIFEMVIHVLPGPDDQILRVLEQDIVLPEADRVFRYMVATDWREARRAITRFNRQLAFGIAAILVGLTIALVTQLAFGLAPLKRLRRGIQDIMAGRESRIQERESGKQWGEDLEPVVAEVNALLDQNDQLLKRARTHVGNLAHALKTPLAVLHNEAANMGESRTIVEQQLKALDRHITHHLKRARISGGGAGPGIAVAERVSKLARAVKLMSVEKELNLITEIPDGLCFAGEKEDFDEVIGNLLENGAKWAKSQIAVEACLLENDTRRPMIEIRIGDDGAGVPVEERDKLFERGQRLDEATPGTGLGLSIVRDIVELSGGRVGLGESPLGGLEVIIILPAKM